MAIQRMCRRCGRIKPLEEFHRDRSLSEGRRYICKDCARETSRLNWRKLNSVTRGLYCVLRSAIKRCHDPAHAGYRRYGGRGIEVCSLWREHPESFYKWALANGFAPDLQLDRIDNANGYEPGNCRFVTRSENQRNRRDNVLSAPVVKWLRCMLANNAASQSELARYIGVSRQLINNVWKNRSWRDYGTDSSPLSAGGG